MYNRPPTQIISVLMFCFALIIAKPTNAQSPPSCGTTVDLITNDWIPQPSRVLYSGDVLCITETGTYFGAITIENGGHVIVCGNATIVGSVTVNPGGSYWHTVNTGFIGALAVFGYEYVSASSCGGSQIVGCIDSSACNFDSSATLDDGSCLSDDACGNCGGSATSGCTDSTACNYDASAACEDGTCNYELEITCPADAIISCSDSVGQTALGVANAVDGCGNSINVTFSDVILTINGLDEITRTWVAAIPGNSVSCTQMIVTEDSNAPMFSLVPAFTEVELNPQGFALGAEPILPTDFTTECDNIPAPEVLEAYDDCSCEVIEVILEEAQTNGCEYEITRVWTATDCSGNSVTHTQVLTVEDTISPVLSGTPETEITINCQDDHPVLPLLTADDNCDPSVSVSFEETYSGFEPDPEAYANCEGVQPLNGGADWGLALFDLPGSLGGEALYNVVFSQVSFYEDNDVLGVLLTGTFYSQDNSNAGWHINIPLTNGLNWEAWSNLTEIHTYKDDFNLAGNNYLDWTYYLVNSEGAYLEGWGDYEGSFLSVSHAPVSGFIGWQHGVGANNVGPNLGLGGWIFYNGNFIDSSNDIDAVVYGAGDIAIDLNCCPTYVLTRTWASIDCAGNEISFTQEITVLGTDAQEAQNCLGDFDFDGFRTNLDLSILLGNYGCFSGTCQCDLTGDGFTSSADLSIFLALYGIPCGL